MSSRNPELREQMNDSFIHPDEELVEGSFQCLGCGAIDHLALSEEGEYTTVTCLLCGAALTFGPQEAQGD